MKDRAEATGLKQVGHRYYDPDLGRFLSRDPIKDGPNWYAYCLNDPVNRVDPDGRFWAVVGVILAAAAIVGFGTMVVNWFLSLLQARDTGRENNLIWSEENMGNDGIQDTSGEGRGGFVGSGATESGRLAGQAAEIIYPAPMPTGTVVKGLGKPWIERWFTHLDDAHVDIAVDALWDGIGAGRDLVDTSRRAPGRLRVR